MKVIFVKLRDFEFRFIQELLKKHLKLYYNN